MASLVSYRWTRKAAIPRVGRRRHWAWLLLALPVLATLWAAWMVSEKIGGPFDIEAMLRPQDRAPFAQIRTEFAAADFTVLVSGPDETARERFVDELAAQLAKDPEHFADILTQTDAARVRQSLLYYLSTDQLTALSAQLAALGPRLKRAGTVLDWFQESKLSSSSVPANPLGAHYLKLLEECLDKRGRVAFPAPWLGLVKTPMVDTFEQLWEGDLGLYLTSNAWTNMILVRPTGDDWAALAQLHRVVDEARQRDPQIIVRICGGEAVAADQASSVLADLPRLVPWLLLVLVILFLRGGPQPLRLLLAFASAALGATWGLAGSLWLLGPQGAMVLVGLPIAAGVAACLAILAAYQTSGLRTVQAGMAMASAFLAVTMVGFPAASQLALSLALTALGCALALTTVYPRLLLAGASRFPDLVPQPASDPSLEARELRRPLASSLILLGLMLTAFCLVNRVPYDTDIIGLMDLHTESLQPEMEMEDSNGTAFSAMLSAADLNEAYGMIRRLHQLKSVGEVLGLPVLLPADIPQKINLVGVICQQLEGVLAPQPIPLETASDLVALGARVQRLTGGTPATEPESTEIAGLRKRLEPMGPGAIQEGLQAFQAGLLLDVGRLLKLVQAQKPDPPNLGGVDPHVLSRLVGRTGRLKLLVFPRLPLRSQEARQTFLAEVQAVSPDVSGSAVLLSRLGQAFRQAAERGPWLASLLLFGLVLCSLGSVPRSLLAMVVPLLGMIWAGGLMVVFKVDLTPLTWPTQILVLAMGAVLGKEAARRPGSRQLQVIPHIGAIIVFVGLLGAHHPAVASLAFVAVAGLACNVLVALTILPALESLAVKAGRRVRGWQPIQRFA